MKAGYEKEWDFKCRLIREQICVCMYKIVAVGKETYENNTMEVIVDGIGTL